MWDGSGNISNQYYIGYSSRGVLAIAGGYKVDSVARGELSSADWASLSEGESTRGGGGRGGAGGGQGGGPFVGGDIWGDCFGGFWGGGGRSLGFFVRR